jgi:hypothetical protein
MSVRENAICAEVFTHFLCLFLYKKKSPLTTRSQSVGRRVGLIFRTMDGFGTTDRLQRAMRLVVSSSSSEEKEEKEEGELLEKCKLYERATVIPYEFIKALSSKCVQITAASGAGRKEEYMMHNLLRGSELILKAPKRRTPKTPEFARKLERLRERLEEEKYEAMVADVTKATGGDFSEKSARERRTSSIGYLIRNDLGLAVHVMTLMAACFVGGFIVGARVFPDFGWEIHFACGTVGAICCLFMEAALFIVRGVREDERVSAMKKEN